jgi:hypothetical protein
MRLRNRFTTNTEVESEALPRSTRRRFLSYLGGREHGFGLRGTGFVSRNRPSGHPQGSNEPRSVQSFLSLTHFLRAEKEYNGRSSRCWHLLD